MCALHNKTMIEVMIESWSQRDGSTDWLWSIWENGERKHMGGTQTTAASAEMDAHAACMKYFGKSPDEVLVI